MKKIAIVICLALATMLTSCYSEYDLETSYQNAYEDGFADGKDVARENLLYDYSSVCHSIEEEYGIDPEDAFHIISNYADGESIDEGELINAMWAAWEYYIKTNPY